MPACPVMRRQASVASASSEACISLDMSGLSVGEQEELAVTTLQRQRRAVGSGRLADEDPGLQRARSMPSVCESR